MRISWARRGRGGAPGRCGGPLPGDDPGGVVVTGLWGIVSALLGGFVGRALFGTGLGDFFDLRT